MKKILISIKESFNFIFRKSINKMSENKNTLVFLLLMTLLMWMSMSSIVCYFIGINTMLYALFPLLILSLQISIFACIVKYICCYFIKRIKNQNKKFKSVLEKEKELLNKIVK